MILIEKILGKSFRKILAVCDVDMKRQLNGSSWRSLALKEFAFEIICVSILNIKRVRGKDRKTVG